MAFQLKVQQIEKNCLFELEWGQGQRLACTLTYPQSLSGLYREWQRVYLSFYKSALRGRVEDSGSIAPPPVDWHARLVKAEAKLLYEFHHWLRSAQLFEIRSQIARGAAAEEEPKQIDIFLRCYSTELERLPWETWEIGAEFPVPIPIRIARTPASIRAGTVAKRPEKARILAVLGDNTGLDFQGDRAAVKPLLDRAEIQFVGWQPGKDIEALKTEICSAIADEAGWDILLFAGHSNETDYTGGELAIAPHTVLSLAEIAPYLLQAKERGLQFALFNSCSGLSLANSLIDLGLSQVAVMREPIHNDVAQLFLRGFLAELATGQDVQDCLVAACQYLKLEANLTYPSAYLVPSLFRHPAAELFQLQPRRSLRDWLQPFIPSPVEAIALAAIAALSLVLPVQDWLLERRVLTQAMYRQQTQQLPAETSPPVLLIAVDEESIRKAGIAQANPMDRQYLARIIDKLAAYDARIIGVDYLLDRPHDKIAPGSDRILSESVRAAVEKQPATTFVFASNPDEISKWLDVLPEIARPNWSLRGQVYIIQWNLWQLPAKHSQYERLPFSYLLALARQAGQSPAAPAPDLDSQTDFFAQLNPHLQAQFGTDYRTFLSPRAQEHPLTRFSYGFKQMWLHPIIDFSIPPWRAYQSLTAWELLENSPEELPLSAIANKVVILAPGGYTDAGVNANHNDRFPLPAAAKYWFEQSDLSIKPQRLTGGQVHAYMTHHYLRDRLVVPVPDLWAIALAALLAKSAVFWVRERRFSPSQRRWFLLLLAGSTALYSFASLQLYIQVAILLPWLLPSLAFYLCALPILPQRTRKKSTSKKASIVGFSA